MTEGNSGEGAWTASCLDRCPDCSDATARVAPVGTVSEGVGSSSIPSPVVAAKRFFEANLDGSDKTTYHSYHLMYGPFLAPYLDKAVVSSFRRVVLRDIDGPLFHIHRCGADLN